MLTFTAGQKLRASNLQALAPTNWTDYSSTFTLTATVTNPTKGASTYAAWYRRSPQSDISSGLVSVMIRVTIGAGFVAGSGIYEFSMPVVADGVSVLHAVGNAYILDTGTAHRQAAAIFVNTTEVSLYQDGAASGIGSGGPGTAWATGDVIQIWMEYLPAA